MINFLSIAHTVPNFQFEVDSQVLVNTANSLLLCRELIRLFCKTADWLRLINTVSQVYSNCWCLQCLYFMRRTAIVLGRGKKFPRNLFDALNRAYCDLARLFWLIFAKWNIKLTCFNFMSLQHQILELKYLIGKIIKYDLNLIFKQIQNFMPNLFLLEWYL